MFSDDLLLVTAGNGEEVLVVRVPEGTGRSMGRLYAAERLRSSAHVEASCVPRLIGVVRTEDFALYEGGDSGATTSPWKDDAVHARALGRSIGWLHRETPPPGLGSNPSVEVERLLRAWPFLGHDELLVRAVVSLTAAGRRNVGVPVHGSLNTNCVLVSSGGPGMPRVLVTGWEEFHNGDAAQDVGGFVRDCLLRCCPLPVPGDDVSRSWVTIGGTLDAFDVRRPVVESFWRGYGEIRAEADHDLALRAVAFAGWSLFARVLGAGTPGRHLTEAERVAVGIGRALTTTPHDFVALLGLAAP